MQAHERDPGAIADRFTSALGKGFTAAVILAAACLVIMPFFPSRGCGEAAWRAESATTVRGIVAALKAYQNDYGHFPEIVKPRPDGRTTFFFGEPVGKVSDGPNSVLFDVLRAIPRGANANHSLNPRKQKYFEAPKAKDLRHPRSGFAEGADFSADYQGCLFDPQGHQYCIVFTTDNSGELDLSFVYSDLAASEHLIRSPVAAFSLGKDGVPGGKGYEGKFRKPRSTEPPDDIASWH
jgi:hypothetical protein